MFSLSSSAQCAYASTLDPATDEELGTIPEMGVDETKEAIEAAKKAFPAWSRTTAKVSSLSLSRQGLVAICQTADTHDTWIAAPT